MKDNNNLNIPSFVQKTDIMGKTKQDFTNSEVHNLDNKKINKKGSHDAIISKKTKMVFEAILIAGGLYLGGAVLDSGYKDIHNGQEYVVSRAGDTKEGDIEDSVTQDNLKRGSALTVEDYLSHLKYINPDITDDELASALKDQDAINKYFTENGSVTFNRDQQQAYPESLANGIAGKTRGAEWLTETNQYAEEYMNKNGLSNDMLTQNEDGSYTINNSNLTK